MVSFTIAYKKMNTSQLEEEKKQFENRELLQEALRFMSSRLEELASDKKLFEVKL